MVLLSRSLAVHLLLFCLRKRDGESDLRQGREGEERRTWCDVVDVEKETSIYPAGQPSKQPRHKRQYVVIRVWTPGFVLPAAVGLSCFWYLLSHLHQAPVLRVSLPGRVHDVVSTLSGTKPRPAETRKISMGDCAAQFEVFPHRRIGRYVRTFGCVRGAREGFDKIPTLNCSAIHFYGHPIHPFMLASIRLGWLSWALPESQRTSATVKLA